MFGLIKRAHHHFKTGGFAKFCRRVKEYKKKNLFARMAFFLENKYVGFIRFMNVIVDLEKRLDDVGLSGASAEFLARYGIKYDYPQKTVAKINRSNKGILYLGLNHDSFIEPALIAAVAGRKDTYLVALKTYQLVGKKVAEYIIPVLPKRYASDHQRRYKNHFFRSIQPKNVPGSFYLLENLTCRQVESINNGSLEKAVGLLSEGHKVIMFPAGGAKADSSWRKGIGEIISQLKKRKINNVLIVPVITLGLSKAKVLRQMKNHQTSKQKTLEVKMKIGRPIDVKNVFARTDPLETADLIRKKVIGQFNYFFRG